MMTSLRPTQLQFLRSACLQLAASIALPVAAALAISAVAGCSDDNPSASELDVDDADSAPDLSENDTATDTLDMPPIDPWVGDTCADSCAALSGCEDDTCGTRCIDELGANAANAARWICEATAGCDGRATCQATAIPDLPECVLLCRELDRCQGLATANLGDNEAQCVATCSGRVASLTGALDDGDVRCWVEALVRDCDADGTRGCDPDTGPPTPTDDSCANTCRRLADECSALPDGLFADEAACDEACRELDPLAQVQTDICTAIAGCERYPRCLPPVAETSTNCDVFCDAWLEACNGEPGLNQPVCEAYCRGIEQAGPGFDTSAGAECIAALPQCPQGAQLLECATPEWGACTAICDVAEGCGVPAADCAGFCPLIGALEPDSREAIATCVAEATCLTFGGCFASQP